ncbi:MAG TPA: hypothetical protein PLH11_10740 [Gemmobacter sp.]|nr:hypothetical protein [Gemmobacter sp.]
MTFETLVDLFLTPLAGGIGGVLGMSMMAKKQPEKYGVFASWPVRLGMGAVIAITLLVLKLI